MLVEMSNATAPEDPVLLRTYHDDSGVLHIQFACNRPTLHVTDDNKQQTGQVVRLTNLTDGSYWTQATCGYWGLDSHGDHTASFNCTLSDRTWGVRCGDRGCSNSRYGTTTSLCMGTFDEGTQTDCVEFRDRKSVV